MWDLVENPEDRFSHNEAYLTGKNVQQMANVTKVCVYKKMDPGVVGPWPKAIINNMTIIFKQLCLKYRLVN